MEDRIHSQGQDVVIAARIEDQAQRRTSVKVATRLGALLLVTGENQRWDTAN
jgi:hypothetical protein